MGASAPSILWLYHLLGYYQDSQSQMTSTISTFPPKESGKEEADDTLTFLKVATKLYTSLPFISYWLEFSPMAT